MNKGDGKKVGDKWQKVREKLDHPTSSLPKEMTCFDYSGKITD
jgi:hypothetical protein